ncbi:hypothetical protein [Roseicella sp. DB1501]|uniref:hypothetical protein n=1 Tax=Roseicella sp. DB1501 TaxID=2730925 RepID=UPI0014909D2A|nr:hypothetical protein [Roseicella sp. DB1501]NOG70513.1 hypothetical protein [Roseicella sp. DB1501]
MPNIRDAFSYMIGGCSAATGYILIHSQAITTIMGVAAGFVGLLVVTTQLMLNIRKLGWLSSNANGRDDD